jgi:hypothetical protein
VTELEGVYRQEQLDHEREKRFNRDIQIHEMELMEQISRTKAIMVYTFLPMISDARLDELH